MQREVINSIKINQLNNKNDVNLSLNIKVDVLSKITS